MALKNMIKLKDKVTFGRAGEKKVAGRVVKLNPKTAHVKCSNGDVMSVSYGLIQKGKSITAATRVRGRAVPKPKRNHHDPKHNPANFTAKGERAYEHIKQGYGSDPRAKEIAARTVYTMAKTTPGLVRKTSRPPGVSLRGNPRKKLTAARRRKVEAHFASIDTPFSASFIRSFTNTPEFKAASVVNRKEFLKLFDLTPTQMKKYLKR